MDAQDIIEQLHCKKDYAEAIDYIFDLKKYTWVIGVEIYRALREYVEKHCMIYYDGDTSENKPCYILGIKVEKIDYVRKHRMTLYKEI